MTVGPVAGEPGWDYALLIPPGWTRLPTDPVRSRAVVRHLWVQTELVRGVAVSASLTVTVVPAAGADGLTPFLDPAEGEVRSTELVSVGPDQAVRRLRVTTAAPGPTGPRACLTDALPAATVVEYVFAVPDSKDLLLLSFATATHQVVDALVALFDAVAHSLEWRLRSDG